MMTAEANTTTQTYMVPEHNLETLRDKVEVINRKCRKLGTQAVTLALSGKTENRKTGSRKDVFGDNVDVMCNFVEVTITGIMPIIKGWTLVAAIDHRDGATAILNIDGDCPHDQRERGPVCDHCNHNRMRHQTYVLRDESGTVTTVGSTCLKDFVGEFNMDPHRLADLLCAIRTLMDESLSDPEWSEGGPRMKPMMNVVESVAVTGAILEFEPWVSKAKAEFEGAATANQVLSFMFAPRSTKEFRQWCDKVQTNMGAEHVKAEAVKAVEWAIAQEGSTNDFLFTLANLAKVGEVGTRRAGHIAAILPAYRREQAKEQERAARPESNHVGSVGTRETFTLTVESKRVIEGTMYGDKCLHRFRDAAGNLLIWFKSGPESKFAQGETYTVKATVKKHDEYKGEKQTVVNRVS